MPVRRRYHFHTPGVVYVLITLLIALGAFNSQNNLLFWAFGFALAILIVSGMISGQMLMGIRADRSAVPRAVVGEPITLSYRISNRSRMAPAFAIGVAELPNHTADAPEPEPSPPPRRWWWPLPRRSTAPVSRAFTFLVHLGPRESTDLTARLTPTRRGTMHLSDYSLETTFPFGIVRKSLLFRQPRTILVHPRQIAPPPGLLSRRRSGGQSAMPRAARPGGGDDFFTLREYSPGDSPRTIAWRASARGETVLVRQNSEPVPQRLIVLVRLDRSQPEKENEAAISRAAGVISAAIDANYEVGLIVPLAALDRRPSPGRSQGGKLLDDLALIDLESPPARPGAVPAGVARGTKVIAVHAGRVDPSFGPAGTVHLVSAEPPEPALAPDPSPPKAPAAASNGAAPHARNGTSNGVAHRGPSGGKGARS